MAEGLENGHLSFGCGATSSRAAIRCGRTKGGEKPQWLLVKRRDDEADARRNPVSTQPESVLSGGRSKISSMSPPPKGSDAMKAVLTDARFSDPDWIFERKLDGIRCIAVRDGGEVKLWRRNDLSLNHRWPQLATELEQQKGKRFAIDGEVVAFDHGQTSFGALGGAKKVYLLRVRHPLARRRGRPARSRCGSASGY